MPDIHSNQVRIAVDLSCEFFRPFAHRREQAPATDR